MCSLKKLIFFLSILIMITSCEDDYRVDPETFNKANLKYDCPVCNEKMALFCTDCESDNLIWCTDGRYVNSIYCKSCKAIIYPNMHVCFSCDKTMRPNKSCYSSKSNENHPDCQMGIDAEREMNKSIKETEKYLRDLQHENSSW